MSDDITRLKEEEKEKIIEVSKEELTEYPAPTRQPHRARQSDDHKNWLGGVVLVVVGLVFLAANVTGFRLDNWWALFILIPAVANFGSAWADYQRNGRFTRSGRGSITGGLILTLICFTFLFSWSWSVIWPIFLIIGGVAALLGGWFD